MIFSDNNHWRFGWGNGLYNFSEQEKPIWSSYGPCAYNPRTFDIELTVAAHKIAKASTKPLFVAMSGGLDSELIARILLQEKIPFTPLIAEFENGYNSEDIACALDFCRKNKIEPDILRLDIIAFMADCINTPYIVVNCSHLLQMHLMRHAASRGGRAILGVGEQRYKRNGRGQMVLPTSLSRIAVTHCMQAENIEGVSSFYGYTPEMMLSLLREAKEQGFDAMGLHAHSIKEKTYRKYWPDLPQRPKLSGFEKVMEERMQAQQALKKKYARYVQKYKTALEKFEEQLTGGQPWA